MNNIQMVLHRFLALLGASLAMFSGSSPARAADAAGPLPSGIVDFAGRIARNHWYLFGLERRADLEALNRELREAQQQLDKASEEDARHAAAARAVAGARRLLEQVQTCPRVIRVDLTSGRPVLSRLGHWNCQAIPELCCSKSWQGGRNKLQHDCVRFVAATG